MKLYVKILARRSAGAQRPRLKTESSVADYSTANGFTRMWMDFFTEAASNRAKNDKRCCILFDKSYLKVISSKRALPTVYGYVFRY
jgi:hypothetical protein